jgi:cyclopropane fatty-acyl-phospholipid synthase-like methyltransferase
MVAGPLQKPVLYLLLLWRSVKTVLMRCLQRNSGPILQVITPILADSKSLLEIGSGTGQHAVTFAQQLPHLQWQTSDRPEYHPGILAWLDEAALPNVLPPLELNIGKNPWPERQFDAVFTANTCHIMAWEEVQLMFAGVATVLAAGGQFCIYGPFNYAGQFTSASNQQFDTSLKQQAPHMGIREIEKIVELATQHDMRLQDDFAMPANNRLLVMMK